MKNLSTTIYYHTNNFIKNTFLKDINNTYHKKARFIDFSFVMYSSFEINVSPPEIFHWSTLCASILCDVFVKMLLHKLIDCTIHHAVKCAYHL